MNIILRYGPEWLDEILNYEQFIFKVQHLNSEGVLATALTKDHEWYINNIPQDIKEKVKDSFKKKKWLEIFNWKHLIVIFCREHIIVIYE